MRRFVSGMVICLAVVFAGWIPVLAEGSTSPVKVWVTANSVNLRADAGQEAASLGLLNRGEELELLQTGEDWSQVRSIRLGEGWVSAKFLESQRPGEVSRGLHSLQDELLGYARRWLGVPYRYGSNGPGSFDCSGFTRFVYRSIGYNLPRSSVDQSRIGSRINRSELLPGDLVFFHTRGGPGVTHVGIYIGQGYFIHASSGRGHVTISPLTEGYYYERYLWAVRVLPEGSRSSVNPILSGNERETSE